MRRSAKLYDSKTVVPATASVTVRPRVSTSVAATWAM